MNLPRHSITSHAVTPIFNNAHFATISNHDHQKTKESADQRSQDRRKGKQEGRSSVNLSRNTPSSHRSTASFESKASSSRPSSSSSSTPKRVSKDEVKGEKDESTSSQGNMFACATNDGFFIARTEPFRIIANRKFTALQGGLAHVALIDDSSLVVLVGGGRVPRFAPNKVILWDENAEYRVPIPSSTRSRLGSEDDEILSEGTASPPPSTIFSLGREQSESRTEEIEAEEDQQSPNEEEADRNTMEMSKTSNAIASGVLPAMLDDSVMSDSRPKSLKGEEEGGMSSSQVFGDIEDDESEGTVDDALKRSSTASMIQSKSEKSITSAAADTDDPFAEPISLSDDLQAAMSKSDHSMSTLDAVEGFIDPDHDGPLEKSTIQYKIERGREVAELEFGEAVQSIRVESFCKNESSNNDLTGGEENTQTSSQVKEKVCILVVVLQTKSVIFEMGNHLHSNSAAGEGQHATKPQWGIRQRFVLDIHPDSNRCTAALSQIEKTNCALIALPGRQIGHVQLVCVEFSHTKRTSIHSSMAGASTIIAAHTNAIACLELSKDGRFLCTASDRGTILRFWSTVSAGKPSRSSNQRVTGNGDRVRTMAAALLGELRRGSESVRILSIAITPDNRFLAVASDKGTIHFFNLDALQHGIPLTSGNREDGENSLKRFSSGQSIQQTGFKLSQRANRFLPNAIQNFAQQIPTSLLPQYFKSQWSFAQFRIRLQVFSGRMIDGMRHVKPPPERRKTASTVGQKGKGRQGLGMDDDGEGSDGEDLDAEKTFVGDAFVPDRARNLEGGWAHMRGRVNDIRKGERTIQEGIWLDWVRAKQSSEEKEQEDEDFQLIAITSSGGLYRLAISTKRPVNPNTTSEHERQDSSNASSSTILDMYRSDTSDSSKNPSTDAADIGSCRLVQHFRFGKRDEWLE
ncbi:uncharacterized protein FA14DRAFT_189798 [Meira miltonrushii]|uniref:WD40 repeat-like protein n=1 Tax=Meira miltonrushii TaxID=1280837 RepID=A0A316VEX9_9BASI|nr:uncharacterized protein FA14DRAFT_189798 [Meira miltonrushii]PWN35864.1 hypothetical protein FA14DRAFT_189798 [Meira miltonrushii]